MHVFPIPYLMRSWRSEPSYLARAWHTWYLVLGRSRFSVMEVDFEKVLEKLLEFCVAIFWPAAVRERS